MSIVGIGTTLYNAFRSIIGDTDSTNYIHSDDKLAEVLRVNRQIIRVRNPYLRAAGIFHVNLYIHDRVPLSPTDIDSSIMKAEPGGISFTTFNYYKYWDDNYPPEVWINGLSVPAADYTVDYINGRLTFSNIDPQFPVPIDDWKIVQASFVYYKVWNAFRQLVLSTIGNVTWANITLGTDKVEFAAPAQIVMALDSIISNNERPYITNGMPLF